MKGLKGNRKEHAIWFENDSPSEKSRQSETLLKENRREHVIWFENDRRSEKSR